MIMDPRHIEQHERFIRQAIAIARRARENGNHPFGALLVDAQGNVIAEAENTVVTDRDCTGHAETNLMRLASRQFEPETLSACTLYTSTEPCPMCCGAIYWGNVGRMVYGLGAQRFKRYIAEHSDGSGMHLSSREVFARCSIAVEVTGPVLEDEAQAIHENFWEKH